jgi:tetratricopeptide (TPR) repeat protein
MLAASSVGWVVFALAWSLILAAAVQVLAASTRMFHDAVELSRLMFRPANAVVLAAAILVLPLFGGLGPVWLLAYLFGLSWAYMPGRQRAAALVTVVVLALCMPTVVMWQDSMLKWPSLQARLSNQFAERRVDFPTLREFAKIEPEMGDIVEYRTLLGELYRMHGEPDASRVQFQQANLVDAGRAAPLIFLGNMSLEDGDVQLAIQRFNEAIELEPGNALAYRNLSFAYDQSRRFQDGDTARNTAKQIAGDGWEHLGLRGRDPRIRYPRVGAEEIDRMLSMAPPDVRLQTAPPSYVDRFVTSLLTTESMVFWIPGLLGVAVLLIRSRWMWTSQMCTKCGKVFCSRCKTATESEAFCSQCISVFLKSDVVSIDQQAAKQAGIRRWEIWSAAARRAVGVLVPGSNYLMDGKPWLGLAAGFLAWVFLIGAGVWAARVLPEIEPFASVVPIQVVLLLGFVAVWLNGVIGAWRRG